MIEKANDIGSKALHMLAKDRLSEALLYVWHSLKHDHQLQATATNRLPEIREALNSESEFYLEKFRSNNFSIALLSHKCQLEPSEKLLALLVALDKYLSPEEEGSLTPYGLSSVANDTLCPLFEDEAKRFYYVMLRPNRHPSCSRNSLEADSLLAWHPHHAFIPEKHDDWLIKLKQLSGKAKSKLSTLAISGKPLRICVIDFEDGVQLVPPFNKGAFFATGLDQPLRRKQAIFEALENAKSQHTHVLVLPELSVTPELRDEISVWLDANKHSFLLVVPGSFHQIETGNKRNIAHLVDFIGDSILTHRKLTRYGKMDERHEDLIPGSTIEILDTPLGLVALPICKDLSDEDRMKAGTVWADLGCDLLLVPSMSPAAGIHAHQRTAESLGRRLNGVVAIANQWDLPETESHCSLVHSPRAINESRLEKKGKLHRQLQVDIKFNLSD